MMRSISRLSLFCSAALGVLVASAGLADQQIGNVVQRDCQLASNIDPYNIWGKIGIAVGLLLGGVGVVPLGIVASTLHAEWTPVVEIVIGLMLTLGAHFFGLFLASKMDRAS